MNIDLSDFERLTPEQQKQFKDLLGSYPDMTSKMESRVLNTPSVPEIKELARDDDNELDFSAPLAPLPPSGAPPLEVPRLKVNAQESFLTQDTILKRKQEEEEKKVVEEAKEKAKKAEQQREKQPDPVAQFRPEGKIHPVRAKLRATLGMNPAGGLTRPDIVDVGGMKYTLRPLSREEANMATTLAIMLSQNDAQFKGAIEDCTIAFAVRAIDGVPLADLFDIPLSVPDESGKQVELSLSRRAELGAYAFCDEIRSAPTELVDTLAVYYAQKYPPVDLLGKDKVKLHCPEANCTHQRIADKVDGKTEQFFCPIHGKALASEEDLPNPF